MLLDFLSVTSSVEWNIPYPPPDVAHQVKSYQRASQCGTLYDFLRGSGADRELEEGVKSDQTSQCVGLPTSTSPAFILL